MTASSSPGDENTTSDFSEPNKDAALSETIVPHSGPEPTIDAPSAPQSPVDIPPLTPSIDATITVDTHRAASPDPATRSRELIGGKYRILRTLGEGGMGTVYVAEQTEPVRRQVALKLIRSGKVSREVLVRFEAERQALALMDHPNIARIYDGGATPSGQPYFVMELVQGVPITDYCDNKRMTIEARLELFVSVCQAVQHAHQKGIIHRDLKPGNILVTEVDGRATPKVIDFGVAKATEQKLTDESIADAGLILGTPAYMSPEQADPTMDIDTRTDVYALGVILYELLTGSAPIDAAQFRRGAILEMLRMVREVEPPKPSTKVNSADNLPNIAAFRNTEPAKLQRLLQSELDWIVLKALEKDRSRRYESASGFASDVLRYMADEVVEAKPPERWYRMRKFVRRNRGLVIATSLIFLALCAGLAGTLLGLREAWYQESVAQNETKLKEDALKRETARANSERRARDRTRQALDAMTSSITGRALATQPHITPEQKQFLSEVLTYYKEFAGETGEDEISQRRTAGATLSVAHIERRLGRSEEAIAAARSAVQQFSNLRKNFPNAEASTYPEAEALMLIGALLNKEADESWAEAEECYKQSIELTKLQLAKAPKDVEMRTMLAHGHQNLGETFGATGRAAEAEDELRKALAIREKLAQESPADAELRHQLAHCRTALADLLLGTGRPADAETEYRSAIKTLEQLCQEYPGDVSYRQSMAYCYNNLGVLLDQSQRFPESADFHKKSLVLKEQLAQIFPSEPQYRDDLASSYSNLALVSINLKQLDQATDYSTKSIAIIDKLVSEFPDQPQYQLVLGANCCNFGSVLRESGNANQSMEWYDKAIATLRKLYQLSNENVQAKAFLKFSHTGRALALDAMKKHADAVLDWQQAVDLSTSDDASEYRLGLALAHAKAGNIETATAEAEQSIAGSKNADSLYGAACVFAVASTQPSEKKNGYADRAIELLKQAIENGLADQEQLNSDHDLDALREREDFKAFLKQ